MPVTKYSTDMFYVNLACRDKKVGQNAEVDSGGRSYTAKIKLLK